MTFYLVFCFFFYIIFFLLRRYIKVYKSYLSASILSLSFFIMEGPASDCRYNGVLFPIKELIEAALNGDLEKLNSAEKITDPQGILKRIAILAQQQYQACKKEFGTENSPPSDSEDEDDQKFEENKLTGTEAQKSNVLRSIIGMYAIRNYIFEKASIRLANFWADDLYGFSIFLRVGKGQRECTLSVQVISPNRYPGHPIVKWRNTEKEELEDYLKPEEKIKYEEEYMFSQRQGRYAPTRKLTELRNTLEKRRKEEIAHKLIKNFVSNGEGEMYRFVTPTQANFYNKQNQEALNRANLTSTGSMIPKSKVLKLFKTVQLQHPRILQKYAPPALKARFEPFLQQDSGDETFEEVDQSVRVTINGYSF